MKIIEFRQKNVCYMSKNRELRIDRSDVWGSLEENPESVMAGYSNFAVQKDDTVHVVYMYGQGGIGKTFVCREIREKLEKMPCEGKRYVITLDLQRQNRFEDNLKCLADEIMDQMEKKDLFPRFHLAYYNYKLKAGEEVSQEERFTKWDDLHDNSTFSLATGAARFISSLSSVSDVIDIANEGYKWLLKMRDNVRYKAVAHQVELMDEKELRSQLVRYFATDFLELIGEENKDRKKTGQKKSFVFLLDTVESMKYQVLRSGTEEDYLEWLVGSYGLLRLLPDCFWILFGREEIPWQNYDIEWKRSFLSKELSQPTEKAVKEYLLQQLGSSTPDNDPGSELEPLADEIIRKTDCYPLAIENCVDMYFRIWNENLRKNQITEEEKVNDYRPYPEDISGILLDKRGKKIISNRFMQYYTLQEREVLYTLVCLGTWTDELLEKLIWKGSVNNRLIYEEMCETSFICADGSGRKTIRGLMLDTIMEECPANLKKQLFRNILELMRNSFPDISYWLLYLSAVHIARYLDLDTADQELLGAEFIRVCAERKEHADFYKLLQICENMLEIAEKQREKDRDLFNAALIGRYFAFVYNKKEVAEEQSLLFQREHYGYFSFQIWKSMVEPAEEIGAYEPSYEVTNLLTERLSGWWEENPGDYYLLHRKRAEFMQYLGQRFTQLQMEAEIHQICEMHKTVFSCEAEAGKWNAKLWADYYWNAAKVSDRDNGEEYAEEIRKCMEKYRLYCTERETEQDTVLCRMKIMSIQVQKPIVLEELTDVALQALHILEKMYGDRFCELPETLAFAQNVILLRDLETMKEEDVKLLQRMFTAYFQSFYKDGNWNAYSIVQHLSVVVALSRSVRNAEGTEDSFSVTDIIRRGILYLNNIQGKDAKSRMILLVCYSLLEKQTGQLFHTVRAGEDMLHRNCANNLMLMSVLQKEILNLCRNREADTERLSTFLSFILERDSLLGDRRKERDRKLLGILNWYGIETDKVLWRSEYTGDARGEEYHVLEALGSWNWEIDFRTNVWMTDAVLYVAWTLRERCEQLEGYILKILRNRFYVNHDSRACFWLAMAEDAEIFGEEWAAHVRELFQGEWNRLYDNESKLTEAVRGKLAGYDHRFQRISSAGAETFPEKTFEERLQERIETEDYDTAGEMILKVFNETPKGSWSHDNTVALFYRDIIREKSKQNYVENLKKTCEEWKIKDKHYEILRGYAYLRDTEGLVTFYRENESDIWEGLEQVGSLWCDVEELHHMFSYVVSLGADSLSETFLRRMCDLFSRNKAHYAEGVLCHLKEITDWLPFEEVWNRELCIKSIESYNCDRIYDNLSGHLPEEELLSLFTEAVSINSSDEKEIQVVFFESTYYAWLKEKFGNPADVKLKERYPEDFKAKEEYDGFHGENYRSRLNQLRMELRDSFQK